MLSTGAPSWAGLQLPGGKRLRRQAPEAASAPGVLQQEYPARHAPVAAGVAGRTATLAQGRRPREVQTEVGRGLRPALDPCGAVSPLAAVARRARSTQRAAGSPSSRRQPATLGETRLGGTRALLLDLAPAAHSARFTTEEAVNRHVD
eukprot:scaffold80478_cov57-Phaeocystis_antarctica.AAC.3